MFLFTFFQENTKAEEMIRHIVDQYSLKNSLYLQHYVVRPAFLCWNITHTHCPAVISAHFYRTCRPTCNFTCVTEQSFSNPHSVWQLNKFQLSVRNNLQCNRSGWFRLCHEPSEYHKCRQPFRDHQVKWFLCSDMHVLGLHVLVIVEVKCAT